MSFFASTGTGISAGAASDSGAANAKRKLEHSSAPAAQTMKIPRDTTHGRRGSSAIVSTDPCAMKRSFSDGTIYDAATAAARLGRPLESPTVVTLSARQTNIISPRVSVSPRIGSTSLPPAPPSFQHATCTEEDDECDDIDGIDDTNDATAQKHGRLAPLSARATTPSPLLATSPSSKLAHTSPVSPAPHASSPAPSRRATFCIAARPHAAPLAIDMDVELTAAHTSSNNSNSHIGPYPPRAAVSASVPKRAPSLWQSAAPVKKTRNPGNLSLDLSQMEQPTFDSDSTNDGGPTSSSLRRTDSAATCSRVTEFLFVGGAAAAKDRDALLERGITHIINCAASVAPDFFPHDFRYFNLRLRDHASQDIARHFYSVFDFIERARRRGGRVFVHCVKGISRSPTIAMAYLMWYKRIGMYKALDFIRDARPVVDPNAGFIFQLTEWEHLHRSGSLALERTVVFRVEVPREASGQSGNGNGSRAAEKPLLIGPLTAIGEDTFHNPSKEIAKLSFIVTCADYMVVWCGAEASDVQVEASQHATTLLQTFEAFPDKYEIVYHGQESSSFWSLVGALRPDES